MALPQFGVRRSVAAAQQGLPRRFRSAMCGSVRTVRDLVHTFGSCLLPSVSASACWTDRECGVAQFYVTRSLPRIAVHWQRIRRALADLFNVGITARLLVTLA